VFSVVSALVLIVEVKQNSQIFWVTVHTLSVLCMKGEFFVITFKIMSNVYLTGNCLVTFYVLCELLPE